MKEGFINTPDPIILPVITDTEDQNPILLVVEVAGCMQ
jgi:hypothetical protein